MNHAWLLRSVFNRIKDEAECKTPLETGGLLVGYCSADDNHVVIVDVVGPGPNATHRKKTFKPDYRYHREEIHRIFTESDGQYTYLGDWHTHPGAPPYLSFIDKRALRNIARFPHNYINRPVMIVLGGVKSSEWTVGIWRISPLRNFFPWSKWEYIPLELTVFSDFLP